MYYVIHVKSIYVKCVCMCVYIYIYIYIYIHAVIVDFGKSDKIRKISGKVDKPDNGFIFKKGFLRMKGFFSKVQHWRKYIHKNKRRKGS